MKRKALGYLIGAICYIFMCGVVIYGIIDRAYDGYPAWVPWIIMCVFAIMAAVRFCNYSAELKTQNATDEELEMLFSDESSSEEEDGTPSRFRHMSKQTRAAYSAHIAAERKSREEAAQGISEETEEEEPGAAEQNDCTDE